MNKRVNIIWFLVFILFLLNFTTMEVSTIRKVEMKNLSNPKIAMVWNHTHGGEGNDFVKSAIQTLDGGFALAGYTTSYSVGNVDMWLVKTDANGEVKWNRTFGGESDDGAESLIQTVDGGYALVGITESYGAGLYDMWLVKTDVNGQAEWNVTFGGVAREIAKCVIQTDDGGFFLIGATESFGTGNNDIWLVKTNVSGQAEWNKTIGGSLNDYALSMIQTTDEKYAIVGVTESFGQGGYDFWLLKINTSGQLEWNHTIGKPGNDWDPLIIQTTDGGFALAGSTSLFGAEFDIWLIKTNSNGQVEWNQTFGGISYDWPYSVIQTTDGGFAIAGYTYSFGAGGHDMWLVKTDASGQAKWNQTFGGKKFDEAYSVLQTADGGFVLAGITDSYGAGEADLWFVKFKLVKTEIILNSPVNNTVYTSGTTIDLSIVDGHLDVSHVWYTWDLNESIIFLSDPYDLSLIGPDSQHILTIYANDSSGYLITLPLVFTTDDTPPTFTINGIADQVTLNGTANISISPSDANGIRAVEILLDGKNLATFSSSPYYYSWDTTNHVDGEYNIIIQITDVAGNVRQETYIITISNVESSAELTPLSVSGILLAIVVVGVYFATFKKK